MIRTLNCVGVILLCSSSLHAQNQLPKAPTDQAATDQAAGSIQFEILDSQSEPTPCRIHLRDSKGVAIRAGDLPFWKDHFVCSGRVTVPVDAGKYTYEIERGPGFVPVSGEIDLAASPSVTVQAELKPLADLKSEGWYSGDLHVHRPAGHMKLLMQAEDLDFAPVIGWWNTRRTKQNPSVPPEVRFDGHRVLQYGAGEDEREGGALLYFGLKVPLDLEVQSRESPSPMHFVRQAREANSEVWIDIEKPFWWDAPTWLATGQMNSLGICNNHMCRSQMLETEAWGRPRDSMRLPGPLGNGYWTQEIYYHALNCGLRLPPSAGSASGVLPNPVGYNRVYVYLGQEPLSSEAWLKALSTGRCFVTNGPLLRVRAGGKLPGEVFKIREGAETESIELEIELDSNDPVSEVEVIHNGRVVKRIPVPNRGSRFRASIENAESGWFLVRAIAEVGETFRFASTAPWYVEQQGAQRRVSKASADFFLNWVDERIARVRANVQDPKRLAAVLKPHEEAKQFWKQKVAGANADLGAQDSFVVNQTSRRIAHLPMATDVEAQPLLASVERLIEAMDYVGSPLPSNVVEECKKLTSLDGDEVVAARIQELLDPHCLAGVSIKSNGRPVVKAGQVQRELLEQGWRTFLVKVVNRPGVTRRLLIESPNALPLPRAPAAQVASRWMQLSLYEGRPLKANLSGLELEYRIVQIYSRDPGAKRALLEFTVSNRAGDDGALLKEWRFSEGTDGWNPMNQIEIQAEKGSLLVNSKGEDPFMGAQVSTTRGGPMLLRFWAKSEIDGIGQVFWWTKDRPQASGDRQTNFLLEPGEERLYEIPFDVEGELAGVRIDPTVKPGRVRIDWIDLYSALRTENWAKLSIDFECETATPVTFRISDQDGLPAFAKFEIRDSKGRIYPAQTKRLAPDFFFQRHIYRGDGESVSLPPGEYSIQCSRGPESLVEQKQLSVGEEPLDLSYKVKRWIDPAQSGWWSGDHHIHAAGCLHYNNPTQGVAPNDMIRHIMGEDLKVGCCLTWGPCFDFQKRFFTGEVAEQSRYPYTLRYDVEVSGFGSHNSGHLNLLNLKEQIYPGGESKDHWPTLGLNTLKWAKRQGAVCGPAHSSIGLTRTLGRLPGVASRDGPNGLPNFELPAFDGIGANEFVMNVTHKVPGPDGTPVPAVDFISTMNTERVAEWNMWYHVLNCGYRVVASGETDFPCMSGERVGIGRVYAKVDGRLTFQKWVQSVGAGRSYVSDGFCHVPGFRAIASDDHARAVEVGLHGSELRLDKRQAVRFEVEAAALLAGKDKVKVELVVNGYPVVSQTIEANGAMRELSFDHELKHSSWVALRVFPHAHTNPIWVVVDDKPIRGTIDSARWCLAGVEQCWQIKSQTYALEEQEDARSAYDHARAEFQRLIESHPRP